MAARDALLALIALAVLAPAAGFAGFVGAPALRSAGHVELRSAGRGAAACAPRMQAEQPGALDVFRRRAQSFVAGVLVSSSLVTGTPHFVQPAYAAKEAAEAPADAGESAVQKSKKAKQRAEQARKELEAAEKQAEAEAKAAEKKAKEAKKEAEKQKKAAEVFVRLCKR